MNDWNLRLVTLPMAQPSHIESRLRAILQKKPRGRITRSAAAVSIVAAGLVLLPLAALRPAAKAALPPDQAGLAAASAWKAVLPNGVGVELVGVMHTAKQSVWWTPDGVPLAGSPFRASSRLGPTATFDTMVSYLVRQKEVSARQFAIRLTGVPAAPIVTTQQFIPSYLGSGNSAVPRKHLATVMQAVFSTFPKTSATCTLRYGVALGPWQTSASVSPRLGAAKANNGQVVLFARDQSRLLNGRSKSGQFAPALTVSDSLGDKDRRVIAIDRTGQVIPMQETFTEYPDNRVRLHILLPSAALSHIREFQLQTREYQWAEFKNVALQPKATAPAKKKFVGYDFTWGAVPGHPEKSVAQMRTLYQWLAAYRGSHGGAYPANLSDLMNDMQNAPQTYGFPAGRRVLQADFDKTIFNPDIRFTNMRSMGSRTVPYRMFLRRPDDTPIGGPKAAGERDVLAYTDMYVQQNWKSGIPTTQTGFYLVMWDDGQIEKIPWNKLLYVPYGEMARRMGAGETPRAVIRSHSREIRNGPGYVIPFRQAFPGQPGLGTQALSWDEYHKAI